MPKKKSNKVERILTGIEEQLEKQNSPFRVFLLGLFRGFGTALGATVLLAIATSIALQLSDSFDVNAFVAQFFSDAVLD